MPSRSLVAALILFLGFATAAPVAAQETGTVRGRVTSTTGVPLRGAEVRVRDPNGRENRLVTTDEEGRFEVVNLVPGSWTVSAAKGGFLTQQYGQRGPFSAPQMIPVARQ